MHVKHQISHNGHQGKSGINKYFLNDLDHCVAFPVLWVVLTKIKVGTFVLIL